MTNVVRFPIEQRLISSYEVMVDLAPDYREVSLMAERWDLGLPDVEYRQEIERMTVDEIDRISPEAGLVGRRTQLNEMRASAIAAAIRASSEARDAVADCQRADEVARMAEARDDVNAYALRRRAEKVERKAAVALLEGYQRCEAACAVSRVVGLSLTGRAWHPDTVAGLSDWLCG